MAKAAKAVVVSGATQSAKSMARSLGAVWRRLGRVERSKRWPIIGALSGFLISLLVLGVWQLGLLAPIEWLTLDARFIGRYLISPQPQRSPVVVVAIDDRAVATYGRWPWPRAIQAELILDILDANPAVLGIDIVYAELDDAWADSRLARVLARQTPVVLAAAKSSDGELFPEKMFLTPNAHLGHINTAVDWDGVVRRIDLDLETSRGLVRAFSWQVAALYQALKNQPLEVPPLDAAGRFYVNYRLAQVGGALSAAGIAETVSAADILEGRMRDRLTGRPVLLGVTAGGLETHDRHLTPLRPLGSVAGVYIHAAAVSSILDGDYIVQSDGFISGLLVLATGLIMGVAGFGLRPWQAAAVFAAIFIGAGGAALYSFVASGVWVPVAPLYVTVVITYGASLLYGHTQAERESRRIKETFRRYVSPEVVDLLLDQPDVAQIEGGRREVTVLFADVRGFTAYAESTPPEVVVRQLNRRLEVMAESVLLHGGMVDKFVGDGVMALFGAPLPVEDHAERAVKAALHMLRQIEFERKAGGGKRDHLPIGVGIHTGEAIVGSIGSPRRKEYTAIGDAVNVAARLQELAPSGSIVASAETMEKIGKRLDMHVEPLGATHIRGRAEPVELFRLTPGPGKLDIDDLDEIERPTGVERTRRPEGAGAAEGLEPGGVQDMDDAGQRHETV